MNFYGSEGQDVHTIAGRLIPLSEALYIAVQKAANRPVSEPKYSVSFPVWGHNICGEFTKTIFRKLVAAAPDKDRFDARGYGQIVGMLLRGVSFWFKDVPAQLKSEGLDSLSPENEAKLKKIAGMEQVFPVVSAQLNQPVTNEDDLLKAGGDYLAAKAGQMMAGGLPVLQYLAQRPVAEQYEFLCGLPEGFAMVINQEGEFANKRGRYEIYLILLTYWPEIVEMQREQPPKTRRDLLEWLEKQEGRPLFEDPKAFYELCGDIDLDLAPPGPPSKSQPQ